MKQAEVYKKLSNFYPGQVSEYSNTVQVTIPTEQRGGQQSLTVQEIYAALQYQGDKRAIKQIDQWTVVILCDD